MSPGEAARAKSSMDVNRVTEGSLSCVGNGSDWVGVRDPELSHIRPARPDGGLLKVLYRARPRTSCIGESYCERGDARLEGDLGDQLSTESCCGDVVNAKSSVTYVDTKRVSA